jgi:hypothetical protein
MPTYAQLKFEPAAQAYTAACGIDFYACIKVLPGTVTTTPTMQWQALYLGNATVRSLGGADKLESAINLCQVDATGLAT